jgi:hypothetical protein
VTHKAAFELNMVKALFAAMPSLRQRSLRPSDTPEVDVLVTSIDGREIGVEVTRLHPTGGVEARRWESTQQSISRRAQQMYENDGFPPVEVVILWSEWVDPSAKRITDVARCLKDFVVDHLPDFGHSVEVRLEDVNRSELPHGIAGIQIRRFFPDVSHWHAPRAGFPGTITAAQIRERISAKDAKLRVAPRFSERWLVLAFGGEGRSTWGRIPDDLVDTEFRSCFDRAFLVDASYLAIELLLRRGV